MRACNQMAKRELHPWVVVFAMLSLFHNLATFSVCLFYYVAVFADLCHEMNLPMFSVCRNVYASGVFDLCHVGTLLALCTEHYLTRASR
jgi:hypothetical protein